MTPEERDLVFSLITLPGQTAPLQPDAILAHFESNDGRALGHRLLDEANDAKDADDLEAALVVCGAFGVGDEHVELLCGLLYEDWHQQHENLVSLLDRIHSPNAVRAISHVVEWVPSYLDYDDSRALAVKALWALGDTSGEAADEALRKFAGSGSEIVRENAERQLRRR